MESLYLALPLAFHQLIKGKSLERCSLKQSIAHHLHLILTTAIGELGSDEQYGCGLWNTDFDNLTSRSRLKDEWLTALTAAIVLHERRLDKPRAELQLQQEELAATLPKRIKNRLDITIKAVIRGTNEPIVYRDHFFVSPLSYN
ncbi:MAG: GPW/gp25 family protein [Flavihumibacter sp.]